MKAKVRIWEDTPRGVPREIDGLIPAAYWIGTALSNLDVGLRVSVRCEPGLEEDPGLREFVSLLMHNEIGFAVDFVPRRSVAVTGDFAETAGVHALRTAGSPSGREYQEELRELRRVFKKGGLTKKQYDSNRQVLLAEWKREEEDVLKQASP